MRTTTALYKEYHLVSNDDEKSFTAGHLSNMKKVSSEFLHAALSTVSADKRLLTF